MKIGIIGAGMVGESLGRASLKAGHTVMFSSRNPVGTHAQKVRQETGAPVGTVEEVIAFGDLVALAMPPDDALQVGTDYHDQLLGKVLIDMNNRFSPVASRDSFAQDLALASGARVVKAFNTIGAEHYQDPVFDGQQASMFIAGDDPVAKQQVAKLAQDIGFDVVDAGGLDAAALLEKLAQLWVHLVRNGSGREIAFKLLHR